jgi:glyoxylase-like metal-dependent hydrolase (beta-lactamase superfamily II)
MKYFNYALRAISKTAAAALISFCALTINSSKVLAQSQSIDQAGYFHLQIGDFDVIALSDGTIPQNLHQLLKNDKPGEIDGALKKDFQTDPIEVSVNAYLIKSGDQLILVDAGTAGNYGPSLGHLTESLAKAGYKPEQINAVLITHNHIDHTGGLMNGEQMVFPNATIYISKPEVDFWFGSGNKEKAPEGLKNYYAQAEASVGPYLKAGKVKTFTYGKELFPGITPIATPGHTPGHTAYALQSKGQKIVFWGDIMHIAAVQFPDPAVTIVYDVDQPAAKAQREKVFADAAKNGYWVAGDHLSFPGIGHMRAQGQAYVYIPANYTINK